MVSSMTSTKHYKRNNVNQSYANFLRKIKKKYFLIVSQVQHNPKIKNPNDGIINKTLDKYPLMTQKQNSLPRDQQTELSNIYMRIVYQGQVQFIIGWGLTFKKLMHFTTKQEKNRMMIPIDAEKT